MTEENPKTTEELVFLTPAIRYTLKTVIGNCKITQKYLREKCKMDSERDVHARIQHFATN
jgi:hypothetical protein